MKRFLALIALLVISPVACAWHWNDLWLRPDQQGMKLFGQKKYQEAAEHFDQSAWQGAAHYRASDFAKAAGKFAHDGTAVGHYNYGNALAQQSKLAEALKEYEEALKLQPNFKDAQFNYDLLKAALKNEAKQSEQQQQNQQGKSASDSSQQQGQQGKSASDPSQQKSQQGQPAPGQSQHVDNNQNGSNANPQQQNSGSSLNNQEKASGSTDQNPKQFDNSNENFKTSDQPQKSKEDSGKKESGNLADQENNKKTPNQRRLNVGQQNYSDVDSKQQQKNELQQWLQQVPDDPAALLRRKFWRDHQRKQWEQQRNSS